MTRRSNAQINIRSDFVRERASQLAAETGKTVTQVVEDAVRAYRPPPPAEEEPLPEGFEWRGGFIVQVNRPTSIEEILRYIDEDRNRSPFHEDWDDADRC